MTRRRVASMPMRRSTRRGETGAGASGGDAAQLVASICVPEDPAGELERDEIVLELLLVGILDLLAELLEDLSGLAHPAADQLHDTLAALERVHSRRPSLDLPEVPQAAPAERP